MEETHRLARRSLRGVEEKGTESVATANDGALISSSYNGKIRVTTTYICSSI